MLLSDISIKRPVFASVLSLLLIAFGLVAFDKLSLREYPDIDPPVVTVGVDYVGAPANIIETRITRIIEERIAGIEGIEFIESSSSDGRSSVTIEFSIDRNIDAAANDVRDRIAGISDDLPEEADPPEVQKVDSNDDVVIWQNLASDSMTLPELTDYAQRYLVDQYSTLSGVARVRVGGGLDYAMRIWIDRQEMAARQLSVSDIEAALRAENIELPAGTLESDQRLFKARIDRNFKQPEDFKKLIIGKGENGYLIRLADVARVELGVVEDRTIFRGNELPMVGIGIIRQSTANTLDVASKTIALSRKLNKNLPNGMQIYQSYNAALFIKASIREVFTTLFISIAFVILVIYLFLGNMRAMLIPAVTVPVSLIATLIVMEIAGFSINLLTLLAMVLAIGLVVDDAIVMLENIVRRMDEYGETALIASYRGARQVGFAVIATTLVLIAVFVPIIFLEGDIGQLFTEFALTIAAAVGFSSLVALTLCPMLASKMLKNKESQPTRFIALIDGVVGSARRAYLAVLTTLLTTPSIALIVFALIAGGLLSIYPTIPQELVPKEDRGAFFVSVKGPEGASFAHMEEYVDIIEQRLIKYVDGGEASRMLVRAPSSFGAIENFNSAFFIVLLKDWAERRPANVIMNEIRQNLSDLPGIRAFPIMRQGLGGGNGKPVQFTLGGATYEELAQWRDIVLQTVAANNPGLEGLDSDYEETRPQIDFVVDYQRASDLGVTIEEIGSTLQTMMGGRNVTTFLDKGEEYDVIVEGERDQQSSFNDVLNIYARSDRTGELVPISNLVEIKEYGAAQTLSRYNRIRSITLEANLADGYTLGQALTYLESVVRDSLPAEAIIDYKGQSRDFVNSDSSILFVFALGLLVVFLVLAAQFESWIHPLVIMLTVPLTMGGGLLGLYLTGSSLNIYSQIGLIMLVGLAAKNGILIVEFANQLRDSGMRFDQALVEASDKRFRPIVMTGLTTAAGSLPLVMASGAGAETRIVIGIVVLAGVLASTFFTLLIVPVAYSLIARGTGSPNDVARMIEEQK
ncbi:UNVERIFIED_CONTAM: hypothetical protein GTU68_066627 [Idotea baltica]|nr:hypothetical protein [Idotea baltica]